MHVGDVSSYKKISRIAEAYSDVEEEGRIKRISQSESARNPSPLLTFGWLAATSSCVCATYCTGS